MLSPDPPLPVELAPAWEAVLREWSNDARHAAFIELAALADRLPDAAACYRRVRESDEARAAEAERQLQRIVGRALTQLARQSPEPTAPRARRAVLGIALVIASLLMGSAIYAATRILEAGGG